MWKSGVAAGVLLAALTAGAAQAQVKVGIVMSLSGPVSSIGLPYEKGFAVGQKQVIEVGGQKLVPLMLDDTSDPSVSTREARKLIEEDKVDILIGSAGSPASLAAYSVAQELKVPMIVTGNVFVPGERGEWEITIPQPAPLMLSAVAQHMKKAGIKTVGFIGYSDAWGDLVYDSFKAAADPLDIKMITNERYARPDTTVTAQVLKIVAAHPDAILEGGSGSPGALPHIALRDRGYRGPQYASHAIINTEFVRVGGTAVDGVIAPSGPIVVADQLPESNPIRKVALGFIADYNTLNKTTGVVDAFAAYAYDTWLIAADTAKRALATGKKPGTPEFRLAMRDALVSTKDVVGTHAVYNFHPGERYGTDERSRVMVQLVKGEWKLLKE